MRKSCLLQGGFNIDNWQELQLAIQRIIRNNEAREDTTDQYGTYYQVIGQLQGINHKNLTVVTIWLKRKSDDQFQFVTLKPYRK